METGLLNNIRRVVPGLLHKIKEISGGGGGAEYSENYNTVNKIKAGNVLVSVPGGRMPETGVEGVPGGVPRVKEQQGQVGGVFYNE